MNGSLPAHRQSGPAERPAAAAGGCQTAPGPGASKGVRGPPRQRERICNGCFCTMELECLDFWHKHDFVIVSFSYSAAERSSGVSTDVWTDEAAGSSSQTAGISPLLKSFFLCSQQRHWASRRLCFPSSCHCTQRNLKSFRRHCPRATRCSPPLNRRWRRWGCEPEGRNSAVCAPGDTFVFDPDD